MSDYKKTHYLAGGETLEIIQRSIQQRDEAIEAWCAVVRDVQGSDDGVSMCIDSDGRLTGFRSRPQGVPLGLFNKLRGSEGDGDVDAMRAACRPAGPTGDGWLRDGPMPGYFRPRRSGKGVDKALVARWNALPRCPTWENFAEALREKGWRGEAFFAGRAMYQPVTYEQISGDFIVTVNSLLDEYGERDAMGFHRVEPGVPPDCAGPMKRSAVELLREKAEEQAGKLAELAKLDALNQTRGDSQ